MSEESNEAQAPEAAAAAAPVSGGGAAKRARPAAWAEDTASSDDDEYDDFAEEEADERRRQASASAAGGESDAEMARRLQAEEDVTGGDLYARSLADAAAASPEQREQMEANRQRALARKRRTPETSAAGTPPRGPGW